MIHGTIDYFIWIISISCFGTYCWYARLRVQTGKTRNAQMLIYHMGRELYSKKWILWSWNTYIRSWKRQRRYFERRKRKNSKRRENGGKLRKVRCHIINNIIAMGKIKWHYKNQSYLSNRVCSVHSHKHRYHPAKVLINSIHCCRRYTLLDISTKNSRCSHHILLYIRHILAV